MGIDTSQVDDFFYSEMAPVIHTCQSTMELQKNPIGDYLASASRVYTTSEVQYCKATPFSHLRYIHTTEQRPYFSTHQMLTMVNPAISYRTPDGHIEDVGMRIKRLFEMLDAAQIEHITESLLRSLIRSSKGCKAKATQYFLQSGTSNTVIRRDSDSIALACVCIPNRDIPDEFFDHLHAG